MPTSTLHRGRDKGGLGLTHVKAKCTTLFLTRLMSQLCKQGTVTAEWISTWRGFIQKDNPPNQCRLPPALEYLRPFFQECAYIGQKTVDETQRSFKARIYETQTTFDMPEILKRAPRMECKQPAQRWDRIWRNISHKHLTSEARSAWFRAVHDIIPTNVRLHTIRLRETPRCMKCGQTDTIMHRVMSCETAQDIWSWTRFRIALMLRTDPRHVPFTWLLFPTMQIWPPQRHNAILWMLGHMVQYTTTKHPTLMMQDYIDFMRRSRWKTYQWDGRKRSYGNYLDVLAY